jgi:hypothetical protein
MTYTMPVISNGTDREKAVLDTVNYGGAGVTIGRTFFTFFILE